MRNYQHNKKRDPRIRREYEHFTLHELLSDKKPVSEYIHKFYEVDIDIDRWDAMQSENINPVIKDMREEIKEQLFKLICAVANDVLSAPAQKIFAAYYIAGENQAVISETLNVTQGRVSKCLFGVKGKGGAVNRLKKKLQGNQVAEDLLLQLQELAS